MHVTNVCMLCNGRSQLIVRFIALQTVCYVSRVGCVLPMQPHSAVVAAGQKVILHCSTSLNSASVAWFHVASGSSSARIIYSSHHPLMPTIGVFSIDKETSPGRADLVIDPVGLSQAGLYICRDNDGFSPVSAKAEVVVLNSSKLNCDVRWIDVMYVDKSPTDDEAVIFECSLTYAGNLVPLITRTNSTSVMYSNTTASVKVADNSYVNTVALHMLISVDESSGSSHNITVAFHNPSIVAGNGSRVETSRMCRCSHAMVEDQYSKKFPDESSPEESSCTKSHEQTEGFDNSSPVALRVSTESLSGVFIVTAELQLQHCERVLYECDAGNTLLCLLHPSTLHFRAKIFNIIIVRGFIVMLLVGLFIMAPSIILNNRLHTFRRATGEQSAKDVEYNNRDPVFNHKILTNM